MGWEGAGCWGAACCASHTFGRGQSGTTHGAGSPAPGWACCPSLSMESIPHPQKNFPVVEKKRDGFMYPALILLWSWTICWQDMALLCTGSRSCKEMQQQLKNYPGWNRNLLKFKMELPWAIFLPAVGDSPSALSRVCCSHAQHVLPMGHRLLEAKQGGRAFFPGKDTFLPFQQKKLCLTLGYNILRHSWGFSV